MTLLPLVLLLEGAPQPNTLAVFPPDAPAASPETLWIGEAVADALPRALAQLGVSVVERSDRLRVQEALAIPRVPLTRATSIKIADALGASRLVVGGYEVGSAGLTLSLRLLSVERGTLSAPLIATGPLETLPDQVARLAWDVALTGPTRPGVSREEFLARPSVPFEAFRAYGQALTSRDAASRVKLLRRTLALAPRFDAARITLGRLHLEAREFSPASEALAQVRADSPQVREARFLQGVALLELGRYRDASVLYANLAEKDPTAAVLNNLAVAHLRLKEGTERASDVFRKAVELAPGSSDMPFNLGWALLAEGDPEAAAFWMNGVIREEPRDAHARLVLVWALRQAKHADEANEEWRALTSLAPALEPFAQPDLARRFERLMSSERLVLLDQDRRTDAQLAAACVARADALRSSGNLEGALKELARARALDPYGALVHLRLGEVERALGDNDKALDEFRMSLYCHEDTGVRIKLMGFLKELGRGAEARAEAQRILKVDPGNEQARALALRSP